MSSCYLTHEGRQFNFLGMDTHGEKSVSVSEYACTGQAVRFLGKGPAVFLCMSLLAVSKTQASNLFFSAPSLQTRRWNVTMN